MTSHYRVRSLKEFDERRGLVIGGVGPPSPLKSWFDSIYDTPIEELTEGDIARLCRQKGYDEIVVPSVLGILTRDSLAGEQYEGELLVALRSVPQDYWRDHPSESNTLRKILESALQRAKDEDLLRDVAKLTAEIG